MRTVNKIIIDGKLISYLEADVGQFPPNSEQEALLLQQIADGTAELGPDDDRTIVPTVDDLRIAGYGSIGDQLDMQYKDALNGTTTWVDHIAAVKAANQK